MNSFSLSLSKAKTLDEMIVSLSAHNFLGEYAEYGSQDHQSYLQERYDMRSMARVDKKLRKLLPIFMRYWYDAASSDADARLNARKMFEEEIVKLKEMKNES